jgi:hypothetical protein
MDGDANATGYLRSALENFNTLYQEKLRIIDDVGAQGDSSIPKEIMV